MATSCQNQFLARQLRPAAAVAGRPLIAAQRRSSAAARSAHRAPRRAGAPAPRASVVATVEKAPATTALDEAYNKQMQAQMGWSEPFSYHFDRGLYFHEVFPRLLCGTQPRNPDEVTDLARNHGVVTLVNLQQDKDMAHWGVDFGANAARAAELGVEIRRPSIVDFNADSLRHQLPKAVREVAAALAAAEAGGGRVYVHCTAGLGRAPAVCIAYLYWFQGFNLDDAYAHVTSIRPCGPRRDAIRAATADLMKCGTDHRFEQRPPHAYAFLNDDDRRHLQARVWAADGR